MQVSKIHSKGGAIPEASAQLTSTSHDVRDTDNQLIDKLSKRIGKVVDLEVKENVSCSSWMARVYGSGGYFFPHHDAIHVESADFLPYIGRFEPNTDNQIATMILYLSEVSGGRTVFNKLGFGIQPSAGTGLFFQNLHSNGSIDTRLMHASCPTVLGVKWIGNKFIWRNDQMWRRHCKL